MIGLYYAYLDAAVLRNLLALLLLLLPPLLLQNVLGPSFMDVSAEPGCCKGLIQSFL